MPYNNYSFVIDSSFKPFSFQEMLAPYALYKDEYDKTQAAYDELMDKANDFKYLAQVADDDPDNGRSAQIYKKYANDLEKRAKDLVQNGLSMGNKKGYYGLRSRYKGEIGRLESANKTLQEVLKSRRDEKDTSMMYGTNNLTLDQFLDNQTPNMYKISGNELATLGEQMGKAVSSRQYNYSEAGSIFGNQYNIFKETQGIRPEEINMWMATAGNELADRILLEKGVPQNLSEADYLRAKQTVLDNIYKGIVYNESIKPYANGEYMSRSDRDSSARGWSTINMNAADKGLKFDGKGGWIPDEEAREKELEYQIKLATAKKGATGSGSRSSTTKNTIASDRMRFKWDGNNPADDVNLAKNPIPTTIESDEAEHPGTLWNYDDLPQYAKDLVDKKVGRGEVDYYDIYFQPFESGFFGDTEAEIELIPRKIVTDNNSEGDLDIFDLQ